ncbi:MAG TPA: Holliday junction branch migration protein RuvA [Acidimicrobiales bacterium]|nr:Holliday junction branch migration protein RuvA [Acidimicrobiales bacterium]
MIGSLRGVVADRLPRGELLVEVSGIGYRVATTPTTLARSGVGEPVLLHVHTHVREDALVLYGFPTREERDCFEALIGARGVGPSLALAILSALSPSALHQALATDDADALTAVPGVGRKTATRLVVELRSRLELLDVEATAVPGPASGGRAEVRAALASLGYTADEVREVVTRLPAEGSVETLLTSALRELAAAR